MGRFAEMARKLDEANMVDGFAPHALTQRRIEKLYEECVAKEGALKKDCVEISLMQKRWGFEEDRVYDAFDVGKMKEHRREILYYLGQLYRIHHPQGRYMNLAELAYDYRGEQWCDGIEPVLKLLKLGYASVHNTIIPPISCLVKLDKEKEGFSNGVINFYVEKTYSQADHDNFDKWWDEHRKEWAKDGHAKIAVIRREGLSDDEYLREADDALRFGADVLLGMYPSLNRYQQDTLGIGAPDFDHDMFRRYIEGECLADDYVQCVLMFGSEENKETMKSIALNFKVRAYLFRYFLDKGKAWSVRQFSIPDYADYLTRNGYSKAFIEMVIDPENEKPLTDDAKEIFGKEFGELLKKKEEDTMLVLTVMLCDMGVADFANGELTIINEKKLAPIKEAFPHMF